MPCDYLDIHLICVSKQFVLKSDGGGWENETHATRNIFTAAFCPDKLIRNYEYLSELQSFVCDYDRNKWLKILRIENVLRGQMEVHEYTFEVGVLWSKTFFNYRIHFEPCFRIKVERTRRKFRRFLTLVLKFWTP